MCLWGAARVILLGYDYRITERVHWFGSHKGNLRDPDRRLLAEAASRFDTIQKLKAEVINCTPGSAVKRFPFARLGDL